MTGLYDAYKSWFYTYTYESDGNLFKIYILKMSLLLRNSENDHFANYHSTFKSAADTFGATLMKTPANQFYNTLQPQSCWIFPAHLNPTLKVIGLKKLLFKYSS